MYGYDWYSNIANIVYTYFDYYMKILNTNMYNNIYQQCYLFKYIAATQYTFLFKHNRDS